MNVKFIAEVSSNHHQDISRCFEFIDKAAEIGCDAIKFQLFKIDELFSKEILEKSKKHSNRKKWELPISFIPKIAEQCKKRKIDFCCTPFYLQAVDELSPHVDFFKIASYELLWDELITKCSSTGKPLVISTGMANLDEIRHAVDIAKQSGCKSLTLLHCVSGYPTPVNECNLSCIDTLRRMNKCEVGWSDHTVSSGVIYKAIYKWSASIIEFHLDLDGKGGEFESGHCWLPDQIKEVINEIKSTKNSDGDGEKVAMPSEKEDRIWRADPYDGLRPMRSIRSTWNP